MLASVTQTLELQTPSPPKTITRPSGSRLAVCLARAVDSAAAGDQCLPVGSKISADALGGLHGAPVAQPPTTSTRPSASSVAEWSARAAPIGAAGAQALAAGS